MLVAFNCNLKAMSKRLSEGGTIIGGWYNKEGMSPMSRDMIIGFFIPSYEELKHFCIQGDIVDNGNFEGAAK